MIFTLPLPEHEHIKQYVTNYLREKGPTSDVIIRNRLANLNFNLDIIENVLSDLVADGTIEII